MFKSRLENVLKGLAQDLAEERLANNRLMAVSGMSVEELTDAFTKGYRLVSPDRKMPESEDAIEFSEKDAIKMLKSKMNGHTDTSYEWAETVRMAIKALEQTRWIPVSERLPEEDGQYLITVKYKPEADYENIYAEHGEWIDGRWDMFCFGHCGEVEGIIAWMPLPEPYKAEGSGEESAIRTT